MKAMLFGLIDAFVDKFSPVPARPETGVTEDEANLSGRTAQDRFLDTFYDNAWSLRSNRPLGEQKC